MVDDLAADSDVAAVPHIAATDRSNIHHATGIADLGAVELTFTMAVFDIQWIYVVQKGRHHGLDARRPDDRQAFEPEVPGRHDHIAEVTDMVEMQMGHHYRVEFGEADPSFGQLGADTSATVDQQPGVSSLNQNCRPLPVRVWPRSARTEKSHSHGRFTPPQ